MTRYARLYCWAFLISFAGSLPLGTLNVTVTNLFINKGWSNALQFGMAAIVVEVLMVRIALVIVGKLEQWQRFFRFFKWLSVFILLFLAAASIMAAIAMKRFDVSLPFTGNNALLAGFILSLLNPLHLPFWMGWTAVLKSKNVLEHTAAAYNIYCFAIGAGTIAAFALYAWGGQLLISLLKENQYFLNWAVGITLLIAGFIQLFKLTPLRWYKI